MLNSMYVAYDKLCEKHYVYKVRRRKEGRREGRGNGRGGEGRGELEGREEGRVSYCVEIILVLSYIIPLLASIMPVISFTIQ